MPHQFLHNLELGPSSAEQGRVCPAECVPPDALRDAQQGLSWGLLRREPGLTHYFRFACQPKKNVNWLRLTHPSQISAFPQRSVVKAPKMGSKSTVQTAVVCVCGVYLRLEKN